MFRFGTNGLHDQIFDIEFTSNLLSTSPGHDRDCEKKGCEL